MSAYGKSPQQQQQPEYDTRPTQSQHLPTPQQPSYAYSHTPTHYVPPPQQPPHIPHGPLQPQGHAPSLDEPAYPSRQYEDQTPRVLGYHPNQGVEGGPFTVMLQSSIDLTADPRTFRFMFGSRRCAITIGRGEPGVYRLTGDVPAFSLTGWVAPRVTVYLNIEDGDGVELDTCEIGTFTYTDAAVQSYSSPPPRTSRKRKSSAELDESAQRGPAKRPASQPIRPKSEDYGYGYQASVPSQLPPYNPHPADDRSYIYSGFSSAEPSGQAPGYQPQSAPPRAYSYAPYPSGGQQAPPPPPPPPSGPTWVQPYPLEPNAAHAANISQPPTRQIRTNPPPPASQPPPSLPSPSSTPNPTLIRTSTLQQTAHTTPAPAQGGPSGSGTGFNPYGIYPHKAVLDVQGELNEMARDWSPEEWESRRRLVQFWRRQKGSTIHTTFRPVAPNDRIPNSICISCIWWAEKQDCFVTSVDCIYLLESLIAVRFTVEEKNRIRRNLEGFRPLTVSKAKVDSENFFKLIMAFPNPKPRNIEKDVKVFPWATLGLALKKIIGKYSASYASTASVIPAAPGASPYPGRPSGETPSHPSQSEAIGPPPPPPPPPGPTSSSGSSAAMTSTAGLPPIKRSTSTTSPTIQRTGGVPDLPPHVTALPPLSIEQPQSQPTAQWHPQTLGPPGTQGQRGSWDITTYLESANSAGPHSVHYPHGVVASESRETGSGNTQQGQLPGGTT